MDRYDLIITEGSRGQESMLVFGSKFRAPNVVLWTTGAAATLNSFTGNSLSIAHIPDYFSYAATDHVRRSFSTIIDSFQLITLNLFETWHPQFPWLHIINFICVSKIFFLFDFFITLLCTVDISGEDQELDVYCVYSGVLQLVTPATTPAPGDSGSA